MRSRYRRRSWTCCAAREPPTAVCAIQFRAGRAAIRAMLEVGVTLDLAVFDEVADPDLLVIPPLMVVESDPMRLGAAAAAMTLERLDGLQGPARNVVMPPLFEYPGGSQRGGHGMSRVMSTDVRTHMRHTPRSERGSDR